MLTLLLAFSARAELPDFPEPMSGYASACRGSTCVWAWEDPDQGMGCIGECCKQHALGLSDRRGRDAVYVEADYETRVFPDGVALFPHEIALRLPSKRTIESFQYGWLVPHEPACDSWDPGFDPIAVFQTALQLGEREVYGDTPVIHAAYTRAGWARPERAAATLARLGTFPERGTLLPEISPAPPGTDEVEAACGFSGKVVLHECSEQGCNWLVDSGPDAAEEPRRSWGSYCLHAVPADGPPATFPLGMQYLALDDTRLCFWEMGGGIYGSMGGVRCYSRTRPGRAAFVDPAGLHLESSDRYPLLAWETTERAWAGEPVVDADTPAHVTWGAERWTGPEDASLAWQAARVGDELVVRAVVRDDELGFEGRAVDTDHVELDLWGPGAIRALGAHQRLALLPSEDGTLAVRQWQTGGVEVDQPAPGRGTWTRTEQGYVLEVHLPLADTLRALEASGALRLGVTASDADRGRQASMVGSLGVARMWSAYPPTPADEDRMREALAHFPWPR